MDKKKQEVIKQVEVAEKDGKNNKPKLSIKEITKAEKMKKRGC